MWEPEPYDLDGMLRVCYRHGRVGFCRVGHYGDPESCLWTADVEKVRAVTAWQNGERKTWQVGEEWYGGMPCNACGGTNTWWDPADGGNCGDCQRTDMDE